MRGQNSPRRFNSPLRCHSAVWEDVRSNCSKARGYTYPYSGSILGIQAQSLLPQRIWTRKNGWLIARKIPSQVIEFNKCLQLVSRRQGLWMEEVCIRSNICNICMSSISKHNNSYQALTALLHSGVRWESEATRIPRRRDRRSRRGIAIE